jgi:hypothetical protein
MFALTALEVPGYGLQPGEEGEEALLLSRDGRQIRIQGGKQWGIPVFTLDSTNEYYYSKGTVSQ